MKILEETEIDEPNNCQACNDDFNGIYGLKVRPFKNRRFTFWLWLCWDCLKKFKKYCDSK